MSTVIIWENNMLPGGRSKCAEGKTRKWPGHSCMNIGDVWLPFGGDNVDNYVSWWPGGKRETGTKARMEGAKGGGVTAKASPKTNFCLDVMAERYLPDHIIRLPSDPGKVTKMQAAWNEIRGKDDAHYRFLYKNCSTIVARVLRAGGFSASLWSDHSLVWTPNKVKKFADGAGGTRLTWAALLAELKGVGVTETDLGGIRQARDRRFCTSGAPCKF